MYKDYFIQYGPDERHLIHTEQFKTLSQAINKSKEVNAAWKILRLKTIDKFDPAKSKLTLIKSGNNSPAHQAINDEINAEYELFKRA